MEKPHKNLEAWKQAMDLTIEIYNVTKNFPNQEIYGITNQVRRAAISVPSNIAEGRRGKLRKNSGISFTSPKVH
jgi:four helix bundle protein